MTCCPYCGYPMARGEYLDQVDGHDWICTMCNSTWEEGDAVECAGPEAP